MAPKVTSDKNDNFKRRENMVYPFGCLLRQPVTGASLKFEVSMLGTEIVAKKLLTTILFGCVRACVTEYQ
jgi:hypothetical protein